MEEIEVVILGIDKDKVVSRLESLGAKKVFDEDMEQVTFKSNKFGRLRLRKEGKHTILNLKERKKSSSLKISQETEIEVDDFAQMRKVLGTLRPEQLQLQKHRTTYLLDKVHFDIDTYLDEYSFVPTFMEIEGPDEQTIYMAVEKLGFSKKDCTNLPTPQIIKFYEKKKRKSL